MAIQQDLVLIADVASNVGLNPQVDQLRSRLSSLNATVKLREAMQQFTDIEDILFSIFDTLDRFNETSSTVAIEQSIDNTVKNIRATVDLISSIINDVGRIERQFNKSGI